MEEMQARNLAARFRRAAARSRDVEELDDAAARDFVLIAQRRQVLGSFKIQVPGLLPFFVSVVSGEVFGPEEFALFVIEKRKGSPSLCLTAHDGERLIWRYKPTRQTGDNARRKRQFVLRAGTDTIELPLPEADIWTFAEQINRTLALRRHADAAGADGVADEDPFPQPLREGPAYWKIAPGRMGCAWDRCRERQCIVLAWQEAIDLSAMDEAGFQRHLDESKAVVNVSSGIVLAWKFRNIEVGDRVVANGGTTRLLGIGTVTGPYRFVPADEFPHQLPVRWEAMEPRDIDEPGWTRMLLRLTEQKFSAIGGTPHTSEAL